MNRFIHASQEIALITAHILIATARNETQNFVSLEHKVFYNRTHACRIM